MADRIQYKYHMEWGCGNQELTPVNCPDLPAFEIDEITSESQDFVCDFQTAEGNWVDAVVSPKLTEETALRVIATFFKMDVSKFEIV